MHGRLKVRSTEEQEERKRLEREKKLTLYKAAMNKCIEKANAHEYDRTGLAISAEILTSNADVMKLWNFRKSIILELLKSEGDEKRRIETFENELSLTEACLKKNPKSYGTWFHRQWCLKHANEQRLGEKSKLLGWSNELGLCTLFLKLDERNFHCWKHRFYVVENGRISKEDELEYTRLKIEENFSNYSAWHYRSKLIEALKTETELTRDVFRREIELIENAAATDPNDQSAWIYEKWLLLEHKQCFLRDPELAENHIKSLTDLLELENGKSKWILLTLIDLMSIYDLPKYKPNVLSYLDRLADEIDLFRRSYYLYLKRKFL